MKIKEEDIFVFTEAYNCSKILIKALETYFKYHNHKVHIFGRREDFKVLKPFFDKNIELIDLSNDQNLESYYKQGHLGTAYIFTKALLNNKPYVVHFDSDVIFKQECLSDIITAFEDGYDLIGQRRPYKNNIANNNGQFNNLPDVVGTCFFGCNTTRVTPREFDTLHRMVVAWWNPNNHPIIDFFDPVSFDIFNNGGKIKYLDHKEYGSCDENGNYENYFSFLNKEFDCGSKFLHFAGIGSGAKFFEKGSENVPITYSDWAIKRYALYMKFFYNQDIGIETDEKTMNELTSFLK